jgi:hypothetical protein
VRLADLAGGTGTVDVALPKDVIEGAVARAHAERSRPRDTPKPAAAPAPLPVRLRSPSTEPVLRGSADNTPALPVTWGAQPLGKPDTLKPVATPSAPPPQPFLVRPPLPEPPPPRPLIPALIPSAAPEPPKPPPPARLPSPVDLRQATERGVVAASNAAAASAKESAPPEGRGEAPSPALATRETPREHVDLLWFDPAAVGRIVADKALGEGRGEGAGARWVKEAVSSREPHEAKDRREILAAVSRGRPIDEPAGIEQVASAAYRDDGTFAAPLILVAGELSFDFDEVETLRAMLTVTAPFAAADKKLKEVTSSAAEVLKADGRLPGDIAAGHTRRIEEAFVQGQRSVAPGYLDTSVERILLEDRRYPRRTLFGEPRLRAVLAFPGGSPPIPAYLPETLATRLPLFRRFRVRAVVELRPQEDQYETHGDALVVLALARVLRRGG